MPALFDLVRGAYPFHNLSAESFESVLRLISGRFPTPDFRDLRARVVWDRIHNRLARVAGDGPACPGRWRHDSGHRPVSGLSGGGGPAAGRARRGVRLRAASRRNVCAGQFHLADRGDRSPIAWWSPRPRGRPRSCRSGGERVRPARPSWVRRSERSRREVGERLDDPELLPWLERECRLTRAGSRIICGNLSCASSGSRVPCPTIARS